MNLLCQNTQPWLAWVGAGVEQVKLLMLMLTFHIGVPHCVSGALSLIQLPVNVPRKVVGDGPSTWTLATSVGDHKMEFLAPNFSLAQPWLLYPFRK